MTRPPVLTFCVSLLLLVVTTLLLPRLSQAEDTVCIQCHGGQQGRLGEPVGLWRESIHARNGISCHGCHGGDPTDFAMAMSPERGFLGVPAAEEIPAFCGRCHVGVKEDYLESAHGQALGQGGPQCVTCHGNHRVTEATLDLINPQDCSRCHEYGRAEEIREAVAETDRLITDMGEALTLLHRRGIATEEMEGEAFSLRNRFHRLFHSVDVDLVRRETAGFRHELEMIQARIDGIRDELADRRLAGGVVVGLLVAAGCLFVLLRKTYRDEE